eukprot:2085282-Lingulodinium_polyedra.AAC.1
MVVCAFKADINDRHAVATQANAVTVVSSSQFSPRGLKGPARRPRWPRFSGRGAARVPVV